MPTFLLTGALFGFLGVAAGAFGAHGLKNRLTPEMLDVFETAVRYQMYHSLALVATAWAFDRFGGTTAQWAGAFFVLGIIVFSGSLYVLSLGGPRWLGAVTPIGGLCFLGGWLCLAWTALRNAGS